MLSANVATGPATAAEIFCNSGDAVTLTWACTPSAATKEQQLACSSVGYLPPSLVRIATIDSRAAVGELGVTGLAGAGDVGMLATRAFLTIGTVGL